MHGIRMGLRHTRLTLLNAPWLPEYPLGTLANMTPDDDVTETTQLDVFCSRQDDAWRTYVWPGWIPRYLRQHLDDEGEAYPAHFDFEKRDRCAHRSHGFGELVSHGEAPEGWVLTPYR